MKNWISLKESALEAKIVAHQVRSPRIADKTTQLDIDGPWSLTPIRHALVVHPPRAQGEFGSTSVFSTKEKLIRVKAFTDLDLNSIQFPSMRPSYDVVALKCLQKMDIKI